MALDLAVWAQAQCRQKAATRFVAQLRFDAEVNITSQRKYRAHRLKALPLYCAETAGIKKDLQKTRLAWRWRHSIGRAYRFSLVASADAGMPCVVSRRARQVSAATTISAVYRAHTCTIRVREQLLHARLRSRATETTTNENMVILAQQFARGWVARRNAKMRHLALHAVTIEKLARGNWGRAIARRARARQAAAIHLQAVARAKAVTRALDPRRMRRRRLNGPTTMIQTQARRLASVRHVAELQTVTTLYVEAALHARVKFAKCRDITRAELCAESYGSSAKYRGEFQAVFAQYCREASVSVLRKAH